MKKNVRKGIVAIVLYGQQRFDHPNLGILRTLNKLKLKGFEVATSGHLWPDSGVNPVDEDVSPMKSQLLASVDTSAPRVLGSETPKFPKLRLAMQATSQHQALTSARRAYATPPELVILTRTDLYIPDVHRLVEVRPKAGEIIASCFHHSGVDDNLAIMDWESFLLLCEADFEKALRSPDVFFGEQLRDELYSQVGLNLSHSLVPYLIVRRDSRPKVSILLVWIRYILRNSVSKPVYEFITSPLSELKRLIRNFRSRCEAV